MTTKLKRRYITKLEGVVLDVPVLVPTTETLRRYGITYAEWRRILARQQGVCAICRTLPSSGRTNLDHEHVLGWKAMPAAKRKLYVRGILCGMCNYRMLPRGATPAKLRNAASYLDAYEARLAKEESKSR